MPKIEITQDAGTVFVKVQNENEPLKEYEICEKLFLDLINFNSYTMTRHDF